MPALAPIKSYYFRHDSTGEAFTFRIRLIVDTIRLKKNDCFWRELVLKILKVLPHKLPRPFYDFEVSKVLYSWISDRVPFRKDSYNVETIQYPEITLEYGGDCDCLVVLGAVLLLNSGVNCQLLVSKQHAEIFDHIALYIPSINKVFDLTADNEFPLDLQRFNQPSVIQLSLNTNAGECNG